MRVNQQQCSLMFPYYVSVVIKKAYAPRTLFPSSVSPSSIAETSIAAQRRFFFLFVKRLCPLYRTMIFSNDILKN